MVKSLIIGGGGVGLGIASCLLKAESSVSIASRPATRDQVAKSGLTRTGIFGDFHAPPGDFAIYSDLEQIPPTPFDFLLICVKSFDTAAVARDLASHPVLVSPETKILLFQNGYGNFETFADHFPPERIFLARVITGFYLTDRHQVEVTVHAAPILIGNPLSPSSAEIADLCAAISRGGIPTEPTPHIVRDLWAKILYNSMLNPLGAIFGATYGALGDSPHSRWLMEQVADEAFAVMDACNISTHWPDVVPFLEAFYGQMLPPTRGHESSMLQSIRNGQRTEIDALNGAVVHLGGQSGIDTPHNRTVVELIKFLEKQNSHRVDKETPPRR
ncbi:MAG: 2-dehydropantoate 2-reductase [Gemmatimonadetes bacterium]|jgi:2-dehydropantoate 2-reductase|nr:2-dehydropantoate 2-reductase [Gemmatimonadota bacterium]